MKKTKLETMRKKLNVLDERLIRILAKRQSYMPAIGAWKKECKLPISYPAREREIIKNMRALAKEKNIDPDLIEKIFKAIFKDAKRIQRYND